MLLFSARTPTRTPAHTPTRTEPSARSERLPSRSPQRRKGRVETVNQIIERNPSASPRWLEQFDEAGLRTYLERLEHLTGPTPRDRGRWVRRAGVPAATEYRCQT